MDEFKENKDEYADTDTDAGKVISAGEIVSQKLIYIVEYYGKQIYLDDKRLEALLKDYCAVYKKEINLIMAAVRCGAAKQLLDHKTGTPIESTLAKLADRLTGEYGNSKELALSTINLLALSLKLITDYQEKKQCEHEDSSEYKDPNKTENKSDNNHGYANTQTKNQNQTKADTPKIITIYKTNDGFKKKSEELRKLNQKSIENLTNLKTGFVHSIEISRGVELYMVYIGPGSFLMGDINGRDDEKPPHKVNITKGYWLGQFQITQLQYEVITGKNPSHFKNRGDNPVENVSWNDCQNFISRLNSLKLTDKIFRLPSEAEWEFACRAGSMASYYWGWDFDANYCWYCGNSKSSCPVGLKKPNCWKLYDMCGNVWEWCGDWYGAYGKAALTDPEGPRTGSCRIVRGGGWDSLPENCRTALRYINFNPQYHNNSVGFRICLS